MLNAECALFALEHAEIFAQQARDIVVQREWLVQQLSALSGVRCFRSDANMLLVRLPDAGADGAGASAAAFAAMRARGVLVKDVSPMHPLLRNCLRLTVGTADENRAMLHALKECI